jgi:hypothetical protein
MAIAASGVPGQPTLFDLVRPADETTVDAVSDVRDGPEISRLQTLLRRLRHAGNSLERARLAAEIRDLADRVVGDSIREANRDGEAWRQIGAVLGVPFQTLFRRYGGVERYRSTHS